jgi:hypothetical protein
MRHEHHGAVTSAVLDRWNQDSRGRRLFLQLKSERLC